MEGPAREAHRVKVTADDVEAREWGRIPCAGTDPSHPPVKVAPGNRTLLLPPPGK